MWQRNRSLILSVVAIISSIALSTYFIGLEIRKYYDEGIWIDIPASRVKLIIFLMKPILFLAPFLLSITIVGLYLVIRRNRLSFIVVPASENAIDFTVDREILSPNESRVLDTLFSSSGNMFQVDLTKKAGLEAYQVSRILKRFENSGWISRKRYGMTKLIYLNLKHRNN